MNKLSLILFILILSSGFTAAGDNWDYVRPELGMGFSDNVYQDDTNKKNDYFAWIGLSAKYKLSQDSLTASAQSYFYTKEKANNYINYSLRYKSKLENSESDLNLGLGGFSYFESDVGSTDEAFSNFYLQGSVSKSFYRTNLIEWFFEPGIKISSFPQLDNRRDLFIFGKLDADWTVNRSTSLMPYAELGLVISNQSYYRRNYLELGTLWIEQLDDDYSFEMDFFIRNTRYPNRTVSDILLAPIRRGRSSNAAVDAQETTYLRQVSIRFLADEGDHQFAAGASYSALSSLSQLERYTEWQVYGSLSHDF